MYGIQNVGFYRDNGLACFHKISGSASDEIQKDMIRTFQENFGLKITVFSCASFCIIILNHQPITKTSNFCRKVNNFCDNTAPQSTLEAPSSEVKSCKVVLEYIFSSCDAGKLRMLRSSQEKIYKTFSHHANEVMLLSHMQVKPPIAWDKLIDEHWLQLDDTVHNC